MRGRIIELEVTDKRGKAAKTIPLYQYDYGQKLLIKGVELPEYYEVHFSNQQYGDAITVLGDSAGVLIPDSLVATGETIYVWLFLHDTSYDGETEYMGAIPVIKRAQPTDVTPTPEEQSIITEVIAALNNMEDDMSEQVQAAEAAKEAAQTAQTAAEGAATTTSGYVDTVTAAQTAAEAAQAAAETAATSATASATSATSSANSANNALAEATNAKIAAVDAASAASTSATTATTASGNASNYATSAESAKVDAIAAKDAAEAAQTAAETAQGKAEDAQGAAETAQTAAEAAQTAAETAQGKAEDAQEAAEDSAEDSEAYAVGTRNGVDVESDDPAYENNAKYYAEEAATVLEDKLDAPATAGTAGQVLTSDGEGGQAWADPSGAIDDTAGEGDTDVTWSADKLAETTGQLLTAIQGLDENAVQYVLARKFHVGENLLTNETTFSGTGWSGNLTNGFTHATGNTDPIVFEVSTEENNSYIIDYDYSGSIVGDEMYVSIGDTPKVDVYHGAIRPFVGIISDGGYLKIYCKSTYTGTITNLKIRPVLENGGTEVIFECAEVTNGQNPYEISAWHNVAIGRDALSKNVNGTRSVAIGDRALEKMVTGHRNIAIGPYAMPFVQEGDCNVSIGADTLYNFNNAVVNGKAYDNIAIGKGTLRPGATEEYTIQKNIAIGKGAMAECDGNSEQNISIGCRAGVNAGDKCVYIGQDAGYYYKGDENVIIGDNAGNTLYHSGQRNVFVGAMARVEIDGASAQFPKSVNNCIVLGAYVKGTESNGIYIGRTVHTKVVIAGKTINFNQDGTVTWS